MRTPSIVSPQEWQSARQELLGKEKALTHARDALAAQRRRMPWLSVKKKYAFDGPDGAVSLLDLVEGRRQLIVYRAFFDPGVEGWPEHACIGCSMVADQVAHPAHPHERDTSLVFASRAPQPDIQRLKDRMGWQLIPWHTITDAFDADFGVDEWHGTNAFIRDGDRVFRTYFIDARGDEALGSMWSNLDMTALGRQEEWEDSPDGYPQTPPYGWWICLPRGHAAPPGLGGAGPALARPVTPRRSKHVRPLHRGHDPAAAEVTRDGGALGCGAHRDRLRPCGIHPPAPRARGDPGGGGAPADVGAVEGWDKR